MTDKSILAPLMPLVRGLYLAAASRPVFLVPGEAPAGIAAIDLTGLDEKAAAAALKSALAPCAGDAGPLPGCVVVGLRGERIGLFAGSSIEDVRSRSAASDDSFRKPFLSMPSGPNTAAIFSGSDPARIAATAASRSSVVAGKIACVTGGAQGFGEEIVRGLASSGAYVFIADMNFEGATRLATTLNDELGREAAAPLSVNVADESSVEAMFGSIAATVGGLDLLVSNAGVLKAASVLDQDLSAFRFVTDVNYTAFMLVTKYAGRIMRAQSRTSGKRPTDIIQINSKSGLQGSNKNGSYAGSKFGSVGLVQSFALELVEFGIKVNAICPGNFFDGPLWSDPARGLFVQYLAAGKVPGAKTIADVKAFYEAKVPMGRGCEGPDVMRAIYYLIEQEYETGQALPVTGGQVMLN